MQNLLREFGPARTALFRFGFECNLALGRKVYFNTKFLRFFDYFVDFVVKRQYKLTTCSVGFDILSLNDLVKMF